MFLAPKSKESKNVAQENTQETSRSFLKFQNDYPGDHLFPTIQDL